ncbi:MAG: GTPase [Planctomycetota bacterium]|jgi:tRNA modification GTPase
MSIFAAVTTGKGTGAIATIELCGKNAHAVLEKIFTPTRQCKDLFEPGKILLGSITDAEKTIDQVTIGCQDRDDFAIHCHGNVLIVEMIMELLVQHGVKLITAQSLLTKRPAANSIQIEAKLTLTKARTLDGARIIANQINGGLAKQLEKWQSDPATITIEHAKRILDQSQTAKLFIQGCTIVLAGPPNSGKSTLFNSLCGKQKAIVTDIKGTTRDWVSARCKLGPLSVDLIDTAGLDNAIAESAIDTESQARAKKMLQNADLILLVLDASEPARQIDHTFTDKKVLTVLNKSDLPIKLDTSNFANNLTVSISAKEATGLENLIKRITDISGVADFELNSAVCFTQRQSLLLQELIKADSPDKHSSIIAELLNGHLRV